MNSENLFLSNNIFIKDLLLKKTAYFEFKFHTITTVDGFSIAYVITPTNIDNRYIVWYLHNKYISIIVDKRYINKRLTPDLKIKKYNFIKKA